MDPDKVEALITPRTKAIWVTHLWGFPAEVDKLREIADRHGIYLLEDCAHIVLGEYKGKQIGHVGPHWHLFVQHGQADRHRRGRHGHHQR